MKLSWAFSTTVFGLFFYFSLNASDAHAECYRYDTLGRLVDVVYDDENKTKRSYELDEHGNRVKVETVSVSSEVCDVPNGESTSGSNQPKSSSDFSNDDLENGDSEDDPVDGSSNSPPVLDDEIVSMNPNNSITVSPLVGDTDPDGDVLSVTGIIVNSSFITGTLIGDIVSIVAGPNPGVTSISYTVSDGRGGSASALIVVHVEQPDENPNEIPSFDPCLLNSDTECR